MIEVLGVEISQQALAIGLVTGLTYATFAAGFVLVYRSTGVLNFAHGEMGAFGLALFVLFIANYGLSPWLAFALAVMSCTAAGAVVELVVVRRLFTAPRLVLLIATIGVAQILVVARVLWRRPAVNLKRLRVRSCGKRRDGFRTLRPSRALAVAAETRPRACPAASV